MAENRTIFQICIVVNEVAQASANWAKVLGLPYHIGYFPQGSYSYVAAKEKLGIELSVNNNSDISELFQALLGGTANPLDELKKKIGT